MSRITKKKLVSAFMSLSEEMYISKITVADVAERAGVNRHTFYYHYRNIDDMISCYVKDTFAIINGKADGGSDASDGFVGFLNHVFDQKQFVLAIMHSSYKEQFMRAMFDCLYCYIEKLIEGKAKQSEVDYVVRFYLCGVCGTVESWMNNGMAEVPEMIAGILAKIFVTDLISEE